ncbi:sodium:alanine symporter family protein [bacterium (Candidatus Blackallbacteria) CG17_big_fil_post_rev_8_21_14_2_50_48_46]|uniref:Sodium:alanine symporter family protein n=1 Tax=bacterium (Candidatus Blackallbacteria) CG17_big_fil_post_rev_8_21_14_2_50_48_46 TaxID=2014261 RepID=A0A2M7G6A9_9BACT|nr:MAG: sodium:alanine symporter family protein [bacterium (Candidatus Blackallbacteria) CG18_big_fil_WC_8_21_14_2_50_49_26]PIW17479.1 MAG: sodium:alanine symporter family protein [bacterium (Candidatus Blackallbacteria) CG17_big_fil_post_rev_8_21_14_2_50_48_46]PIW48333.1 MAG: sodium:alanine symporter family protein [bacterium (Candidatus Blackallbacteria) CG13_big_fil_rev_8_21_14_2_50_49_14]
MDIISLMGTIDEFLWGPWAFFVLMGTGILFTIWTKFIQFRAVTHGVTVIRGVYDSPDDPGAINHFQALSAALSATVGLGNIGGVAMAIALGGPGALFWMWVVGFLGMAIKTVEVTLALMYRNTDDPQNPHGGAMWVIDKTLGKHDDWRKGLAKALAYFFCITLLISTMTGGNMFQAWNVGEILNVYYGVPQIATGIMLAVVVGAVIVGGIKRIGEVAEKIVPFMCGMYILAGLAVLALHIDKIPGMLLLIVQSAFTPVAAGGAFVGVGVYTAFEIGLQRALFSNEAGQGSAPIAHSAAKTDEASREGVVAGLEPFIDTLMICTLTALVILCTGTWNRPSIGEIKGPVAIVQDAGKAKLEAPTSVQALPELASWEKWQPGSQVFILVDVPGKNPGEHARAKVYGAIKAGATAGQDHIEWGEVPAGATLIKKADGQPDKSIFRNFVGASLTGHAFDRAFPGLGKWLVTGAALLFAISTQISWSYYGEQGVVFMFNGKGVMIYKAIFLLGTIVAPVLISTDRELGILSDFGTGWMLWANIPILLSMGYLAVRDLKQYFRKLDAGEFKAHKPINPFAKE